MAMKDTLTELLILAQRGRQTGRSTAILNAAKETNGVVLSVTNEHARHLREVSNYQVPVFPYDPPNYIQGYSGPVFFDNYTIETIFYKAAAEISDKEYKIKQQEELIKQQQELLKSGLETINKLETALLMKGTTGNEY